jgi:two-component system cell cycle sensor histidine kinase/response regulator CckA
MRPPTILVVEDNPVSRKMVRVTLETEGYSVVEAPDARTALALFAAATPDLVLQDLLLPDMDGFELVRRLRALPRGAETPIVALSGFLSRMEEAQVPATGFSDFLSKPVAPARLVETIRAHFPAQLPAPEDKGEGPHVLAADDDPIQLKLMRIRLTLAGFRVSCASDGQEALEMARKEPPAAVLSDVVMPRLDGFRLCLALRGDPRLARVPVVLVSASCLEEGDQLLAQNVGANALIPRKDDFEEAIQALRAGLSTEPPRPKQSPEQLKAEQVDHMIRRLERQAAVSQRLVSRCATQAAALSVLSGIAETLARTQDVRAVLSEVLARCVDAGGLSLGVLYLIDPGGGFQLEAHQGYADALIARLETAFGHANLFREVLAKGVPVVVPSAEVSREVADDFLKEAGATAAVVVPIVSHEERLGVLVLASGARVLEEGDWIAFARTVAAQVGQAVALTKAVAGIAASESRYRALMENASDAILILDSSGRVQEVNHQAEELLGRPRADIVGRNGLEFVAPDERQESRASLARLAQEGALHTESRHLLRADGSVVPIDLSSSLVDVGGQRLVFSIFRDITQRIEAEEALRKLSSAVEQTPDAVFITDKDGVIEYVNPAFEVQTGYSREEALGRKPSFLKSSEHPQAFYERLWKTILSGGTFRAVFANRRKSGEIAYEEKAIAPLKDESGRITHFLSTGRDITDRRHAEQALRASQQLLEAVMDGTQAVIYAKDVHGRYILVNRSFETVFGLRRDQVTGKTDHDLFPKDLADQFRANCLWVLDRQVPVELEEILLQDDVRHTYISLKFPLLAGSGAPYGVCTISTDITDRKLAEKALRESEERYRTLFHRNLAGVYRSTVDGRILECNDAYARIFGYASREDALGGGANALYPTPAAREAFIESLEREGVLINHEFEGRRKGGGAVWLLENAHLVPGEEPGARGFIEGTLVDITERRRLEGQLRQFQKVEAIGQLAGGVAHDFNNILGVITGYGELALRQLEPEHPVRPRVDQMLKAAERAAGLTRQLLAFSRKQVMQPRLLDLNAVVADTHKMLGRLIGEDIQLVIHAAPGLGTVKADPGQIEQIILNIAVNARDAMPKGGSLTLETANVDLDKDYAAAHPPATPGRYVMLAISDTGIGMDQETQQRSFEPFFTTKPEGQGTGLGLATVYGIVKQSGGYIWVYSEPGCGTTFKVYLPRVDEPTEAARPAGPPGEAPRGHEMILLVEDTKTLREVIRETLEERGYTVLLASNGEEALALARGREGPIDLLLTDVVMPKLGGGEVAKLLSALRPEIRVLYMSGYTDGAISQHGVLGEGVMLLEKPFTGDKLARAVREALDGPTAK